MASEEDKTDISECRTRSTGIWFWRGAVVAWCGAIFWLSSQSHPPGAGWLDFIPLGDKIGHAALYAALGGLTFEGLRRESAAGLRRAAWVLAIAWAALYGATDEFHQSFVPGREMDIFDWCADVAGAGAGIAFCALVLAWAARKR